MKKSLYNDRYDPNKTTRKNVIGNYVMPVTFVHSVVEVRPKHLHHA